MVVRVRHVAALAVAASALPFSAHAATALSPTPDIACTNGVASSINWGDGFSFGAPSVTVQNLTGVTAELLPAVNFGCNDNMYSTGVTGSTFQVNFGVPGGITPSGDKFDKWVLDITDYKESKADIKFDVTEFDIFGEFIKSDTGALDHKDFIGVKIDSISGFALSDSNKIYVNADGSVSLDPPIPGGAGFLELIPTPGAPVPEPTSFVLFGTGLLAAAQVLRRKSRLQS